MEMEIVEVAQRVVLTVQILVVHVSMEDTRLRNGIGLIVAVNVTPVVVRAVDLAALTALDVIADLR